MAGPSFKDRFVRHGYWVLSLGICVLTWFGLTWTGNYRFLWQAMTSGDFSLAQKGEVLLSTGDSFRQSYPLDAQVGIGAVSLLFGVYVVLLVFYFRHRYALNRAAGLGFLGTVVAILGVGCGLCGSILLTNVIGLSAALAVLTFLPFKGREFAIVGVGVLLVAIYLLWQRIQSPEVCKVKA